MSPRIGIIVLPVLGVVLAYLVGAFVGASFDITTWEIFHRGIIAVMMIVFAVAGVAAVLDGPHNRGK